MKFKKKQVLSFILALAMVFSQMSGMVAYATTESQSNIAVSEGDGVPEALPEGKSYFVDSVLTANGINDRHTLDAGDNDFVKNKNSFTISFDFKTSSNTLMALGSINGPANANNYISFYVNQGNRLGMEIRNYTNASINTHKYVDVQNVSLNDNNWHTVTYVVDANVGYKIYLDQNQVMNSTANPTHFTGTEGWWDISSVTIAGANRFNDSRNYPYTGSIRNVKMYGQALTADQIALLQGKILQKTYFSTAQTFDGTAAGAYAAAEADVPFVKGMQSGTLVANFKTTATGKQTLVAIDSATDNKFINMYVEGTTVGVEADNAEVLKKAGLSTTVADGKWHTLVYKVEAGVGYELYLDGTKVANKEDAAASIMTSGWGEPAAITFGANNGANLFNGSLKNVKIFTGAISAEELNREQGAADVDSPTYVYEDNAITDAASIVDVSIDAEEIGGFTKGSFSFAYALEDAAKNSADKLTLFSLSNDDATKSGSIYIQPSTQTIGFDVKGGNSGEVTLSGDLSMKNTDYHTVAVVFNGTEASIYFDGTLCGTKATTAEVLQGSDWTATKATLGGIQAAAPLKAYLDTAYVYEGVLTQEQIGELHTSQLAWTAVLKTEEKGLYDRGDYGTQGYRIPALLTTNKGTLIAAIDERNTGLSDCGNINTVIRRSTDGGKTWDDSITVVDLKSQPYDLGSKSCVMIDPCMIQAEDGRIWMLVDMFPEGKAALGFMDANFKTNPGNGYVEAEDGKKYPGLYETVDGQQVLAGTLRGSRMYDLEGKPTDYTVDMGTFQDGFHTKGDMYLNGKYVGNIYLDDQGTNNDSAPYHIHNTMYTWLTYSDDDGLTWSNPVDLTGMVKADWMKFFGAGPGVGLQLKNGEHKGRLIFPVYYTNDTGVRGQFGHQSAACIYSDDNGVTWQCSESPNDGRINNAGVATDSRNPSGISQLTESQIIELNNGHLLVFMRNTGGNGKVVVSRSTDGGETWEDPYDTTAPDVYCQLSVIHYPELVDGKELVVMSNPGGPGGRKNGTLRIGEIGEDDRVTWVEETMFCPSSYYAYSCLSYVKDGEIGLLYETLGDTIKYTSFNLEYIKQDGCDMSPHITAVTKTIVRNGQEITESNAVAVPGDTLRFTVTIDQDVLTKGNPTFRFWINGHTGNGQDKYADFVGYGAEDNQVVFEYEVQNTDQGHLNFMGPKIISDADNYVRSRDNYQVTATSLEVSLGTIGVSTDVQPDMTKTVDVPYADMTVTAGSEQGSEPISRAFDNNASTVWHSNWSGDAREKMWVKFDLKSEKAVSGLRYLPRQDSSPNGRITKYEILVSTDDTTYTKVAEGTWSTDTSWKWAQFDQLKNVRYVKLVAVESGSTNDKIFASAAELRITTVENHEHTYGDKWASNAEGHYHACTAVEACPEKSAMTAHNYGAYTTVKPATCMSDGTKSRTCATCGYVEVTEVIASGHDFGDWEEIIAPTETAKGVSRRVCNNCGTYEQEYSDYIAPEEHTHDYDTSKWKHDDTNHWHKCKVENCSAKTAVAAHTWDNGTVTTEATATTAGVKTYTCTVCQRTKTEEIPATGGGNTPGGDQPSTPDQPGTGDKPSTPDQPGTGDKPGTGDQPGTGNKPSTTIADKTALVSVITAAEALKAADYTSTTWTAMQTALTAAKATNAKADASQSEVDTVKAALDAAVKALVKAETTDKPGNTTTPTLPKKGAKIPVKGSTYKVTKAGAKNGTVSFVSAKKNSKTIAVPATIKYKGVTYKVTAVEKNAFKNQKKATKITIGKNVTKIGATAFANCTKLKNIKIQATKFTKKSLAKTTFKGVKTSVKISVPKAKVKAYKTLFKKAGLSSKVKVTK